MVMRKVIIFLLLVFTFQGNKLFAQEDVADSLTYVYDLLPEETGKNLSMAYAELEPSVLADINWLNNNPLGKNTEMSNDKSRFVLMWMSGSPDVSIRMDDRLITFQGAEPAVLMAYMMGWTKYSLENNYSNDPIYAAVAGITNAVGFYEKNKKMLRKNKELDKYGEMIRNHTLTRYVADIVTK